MTMKATLVVEHVDLGNSEITLVTAAATDNPEDDEAAEKDTCLVQTSPIIVRIEDATKFSVGDRVKFALS